MLYLYDIIIITIIIYVYIIAGNFHDGYTGGLNPKGGILYDGSTYVNTTGQIIVNINYRLGAFGFLYLGTDIKVSIFIYLFIHK